MPTLDSVSLFSCFYLLNVGFLFYSLHSTRRERDRDLPHVVLSPNSYSGQSWASRNQSHELHLGPLFACRDPHTWAIFRCSSKPLVGSWIASRATRMQTGAPNECQHCRQWLYWPCHNGSTVRIFLDLIGKVQTEAKHGVDTVVPENSISHFSLLTPDSSACTPVSILDALPPCGQPTGHLGSWFHPGWAFEERKSVNGSSLSLSQSFHHSAFQINKSTKPF